jgi:hypothetical protein
MSSPVLDKKDDIRDLIEKSFDKRRCPDYVLELVVFFHISIVPNSKFTLANHTRPESSGNR